MKTIQSLTDEEVTKIHHYLEPNGEAHRTLGNDQRDTCIFLLMLDAGLRVGEVAKTRIGSFCINNEICTSITVSTEAAKLHKERIVPLTFRLTTALTLRYRQKFHPLINAGRYFAFYTRNVETPISIRQLRRIVGYISEYAIGRSIHPHILRHTFATRLMRKTSIRVVQALLGHSSLSSTQIYTHPNNLDLKAAIDGIS